MGDAKRPFNWRLLCHDYTIVALLDSSTKYEISRVDHECCIEKTLDICLQDI